jgi:hypothetical protein
MGNTEDGAQGSASRSQRENLVHPFLRVLFFWRLLVIEHRIDGPASPTQRIATNCKKGDLSDIST